MPAPALSAASLPARRRAPPAALPRRSRAPPPPDDAATGASAGHCPGPDGPPWVPHSSALQEVTEPRNTLAAESLDPRAPRRAPDDSYYFDIKHRVIDNWLREGCHATTSNRRAVVIHGRTASLGARGSRQGKLPAAVGRLVDANRAG